MTVSGFDCFSLSLCMSSTGDILLICCMNLFRLLMATHSDWKKLSGFADCMMVINEGCSSNVQVE